MDFTTLIIIALFLIGIYIAYLIGYKFGAFKREKFWQSELPGHRKQAIAHSRAVLSGQFSEQLAPFLPDFEYNPTECKFIGKPIDFVVFKGLDKKEINEIVFLEIKSGKSKLNSVEKKLKNAVKNKKVKWREYRIPEDLTKNKHK